MTITSGNQPRALPFSVQCKLMENLYEELKSDEVDVNEILFDRKIFDYPGWNINPICSDENDDKIFGNINHNDNESSLPNCFDRIRKLPCNPIKKTFRELSKYAAKLNQSGRKVYDIGISKQKKTLSAQEIDSIYEMFFGDN